MSDAAYDLEGTFGEVIDELARRSAGKKNRLRLHVETLDDETDDSWPPNYFGAFESGLSDTSEKAKDILRNELGHEE